jgi:predicted RNase H-like nuclease (RuvC/YqgF family)
MDHKQREEEAFELIEHTVQVVADIVATLRKKPGAAAIRLLKPLMVAAVAVGEKLHEEAQKLQEGTSEEDTSEEDTSEEAAAAAAVEELDEAIAFARALTDTQEEREERLQHALKQQEDDSSDEEDAWWEARLVDWEAWELQQKLQEEAVQQELKKAVAQQHMHFVLSCLCWGLLVGWLSWLVAVGSN